MEIEKLSQILKDVNPDKGFWIHEGPVVRNLYELVSALRNMEDGTFKYHVNKDKNDFSMWVGAAVGDEKLAQQLSKTRRKKKAIKRISKRIGYIEEAIDKNAKNLQKIEHAEKAEKPKKSIERIFLELIISFFLGIILGIVIGILIEHYSFIPRGWF